MANRDEVFTAPAGQGIAVIGSGGKVKLVAETVLLTSAYNLGRADALVEAARALHASPAIDEQAKAEALAVLERVGDEGSA
jgi:hypothetical protein